MRLRTAEPGAGAKTRLTKKDADAGIKRNQCFFGGKLAMTKFAELGMIFG
jgi:hypothetical protein